MKYLVSREYLALLRYGHRHSFSSGKTGPKVDQDWWEAERKAIALLLAHDHHPSEEEYYRMCTNDYGINTYFPFLKDSEEQKV